VPNQIARRSQQQRRSETEQRVLAAAMALIAERGSRGVSLAEVGRLAGYSSGIVSHHFGGKQQLLAAVVKHAQLFDHLVTGSCGLDQLSSLISTYLTTFRERAPAPQAFLLLWSEAVASDPVLAPLFAERDAWFRSLLASYVRSGIDDGSIRADADPEAVAVSVLGLLRGIGMQLISTAEQAPLDLIVSQIVGILQRGLAPATGTGESIQQRDRPSTGDDPAR
jgi:AcrR family transcriptional regulator